MSAEGWTAYDTVQAWTANDTYLGQAKKFYATPSEGAQFRAALDAAQKAQRAAQERHPSGEEIRHMTPEDEDDPEFRDWLGVGHTCNACTPRRSPFAGGRVARALDLVLLAALLVGSVAVVFLVGSAVWFMAATALGVS